MSAGVVALAVSLGLAIVVAVLSIRYDRLGSRRASDASPQTDADLRDPYRRALVVGGREHAVLTALVALLSSGSLELENDRADAATRELREPPADYRRRLKQVRAVLDDVVTAQHTRLTVGYGASGHPLEHALVRYVGESQRLHGWSWIPDPAHPWLATALEAMGADRLLKDPVGLSRARTWAQAGFGVALAITVLVVLGDGNTFAAFVVAVIIAGLAAATLPRHGATPEAQRALGMKVILPESVYLGTPAGMAFDDLAQRGHPLVPTGSVSPGELAMGGPEQLWLARPDLAVSLRPLCPAERLRLATSDRHTD